LLSRSKYFRTQKQLRYRYGDDEELSFAWDRDFPLSLQEDHQDGRSEFVLEFELSPVEQKDFRAQTKINLGTNLKLKLSLGREDAKFEVLLQGKAKQKLATKLVDVAIFIGERLDIRYIPAIRPSALAESVVDDLLAREMAQLEANKEYQKLLASSRPYPQGSSSTSTESQPPKGSLMNFDALSGKHNRF
jgi:hypothetical protein